MKTQKELIVEMHAQCERLDERTSNMWHIMDEADDSINKKIDKIIEHQEKQNGKINKNRLMIFFIVGVGLGTGILEWQDIIHIFGG